MKSVLTSVFAFGRGNGKMNSVFLRLSAEQKLRKTGNRQKNMEESRKIDLQIYRGCDILFGDRLYPLSCKRRNADYIVLPRQNIIL